MLGADDGKVGKVGVMRKREFAHWRVFGEFIEGLRVSASPAAEAE